jgi:tetratricopeptide (TPR) repeat protein
MSLRWSQRPSALDAATVALCAFVVHVRTIGFGLVGLDDRDLVVDDAAFLSRPSALWRAFGRAYLGAVDAGHAYYRPIVTASLALDARWGGAGFASYHATNVALHAAASALVWALLRRLDVGRAVAWISAAAFAVHPALTTAVGWIPGRNDSLLAVFCLGSWLAFSKRLTVVHFTSFALALLTKETAVALPLVCAVHALTAEPLLARTARLAGHVLGWFALLGARLAMWPPSGSSTPSLDVARWARLLVAAFGEVTFAVRPVAIAAAQDVLVAPGVVALLALGVATFALRGVRRRIVVLGVAAFVLWLLPPVMATGSLVLGQRLYLPAVGATVVAAELLRASATDAPRRRLLAAFGGAVLAVLAAATLAFQGTFRDRRSFAREAVEDSPHCALAHFCLGQSFQLDGDDDQALREYAAALDLGAVEVVHNNVAVILMKRARWAEAASQLEAEIALNPRYARAHLNLAVVLRHEGRDDEACVRATRASELASGDLAVEDERTRDCELGKSDR